MAELGIKLLERLHLSVPERRELPPSGLPISVLVEAVSSRLNSTGWFPVPLGDTSEGWTGARLERRGQQLWVHTRHESGVLRLGPIRSFQVDSAKEAVMAYLEAIGGEPVDGVPLDWTA